LSLKDTSNVAKTSPPWHHYKGFPLKVKQISTGVESRKRFTPEQLT